MRLFLLEAEIDAGSEDASVDLIRDAVQRQPDAAAANGNIKKNERGAARRTSTKQRVKQRAKRSLAESELELELHGPDQGHVASALDHPLPIKKAQATKKQMTSADLPDSDISNRHPVPSRKKSRTKSTLHQANAATAGARRGKKPTKQMEWEVKSIVAIRHAADSTNDDPHFQYAVCWGTGEVSWWTADALGNDPLVVVELSKAIASETARFTAAAQPKGEKDGSMFLEDLDNVDDSTSKAKGETEGGGAGSGNLVKERNKV